MGCLLPGFFGLGCWVFGTVLRFAFVGWISLIVP